MVGGLLENGLHLTFLSVLHTTGRVKLKEFFKTPYCRILNSLHVYVKFPRARKLTRVQNEVKFFGLLKNSLRDIDRPNCVVVSSASRNPSGVTGLCLQISQQLAADGLNWDQVLQR